MDFGDFLTSLLNDIGSGSSGFQFGIAPVNLGGVHLYRFDNLTVIMPLPEHAERGDSARAAGMEPVTGPDALPSRRLSSGAISGSAEGTADEPGHVPDNPSVRDGRAHAGLAAPYRLEPLLAFDVPPSNDGPEEFEVAPRITAAIVPAHDTNVKLSQFDAARRARHVRFEDGTPIRIRRGTAGEWVEFNGRRQARLGKSELWSCRRFPTGKPIRLAAGDEASSSVAVSVGRGIWAASWLLKRKDPEGAVRDSSFLILVRRKRARS